MHELEPYMYDSHSEYILGNPWSDDPPNYDEDDDDDFDWDEDDIDLSEVED